jgi:hypothetical protein
MVASKGGLLGEDKIRLTGRGWHEQCRADDLANGGNKRKRAFQRRHSFQGCDGAF